MSLVNGNDDDNDGININGNGNAEAIRLSPFAPTQLSFATLRLKVALAITLATQPRASFSHLNNRNSLNDAKSRPYFNAPRHVFDEFFAAHRAGRHDHALANQFTLLLYSLQPMRHAWWWSLAWFLIDDQRQIFVENTARALQLVPNPQETLESVLKWIEDFKKFAVGHVTRTKVVDGESFELPHESLVPGFVADNNTVTPIPDDSNSALPTDRASDIVFVIKEVGAFADHRDPLTHACNAVHEIGKMVRELCAQDMIARAGNVEYLVRAHLFHIVKDNRFFLVSRYRDSNWWYRLSWFIDRHGLDDSRFEEQLTNVQLPFARQSPQKDRELIASRVGFGVFRALGWLHGNNAQHGDVCARNIVIDAEFNVRLIDFDRTVCIDAGAGTVGTYTFGEFGAGKVLPSVLCRRTVHWYCVPEVVDDPFVSSFVSDLYPAIAIVTMIYCGALAHQIEQGVAPHELRKNATAIESVWSDSHDRQSSFANAAELRTFFSQIALRKGNVRASAIADKLQLLELI